MDAVGADVVAAGLVSCVGAVALGCFISLDRPSGTGPRDGAVLHGALAAVAFAAAALLRPDTIRIEDFVVIAGIAALLASHVIFKTLSGAMQDAEVPADRLTLVFSAWTGAVIATGDTRALVFVLLVGALSATLKARPAHETEQTQQAAMPSRRVELYNTMSVLIEKLNGAQTDLREEEMVVAPMVRTPRHLNAVEGQLQTALVAMRRRESRVDTRIMPRRVVQPLRQPAARGQGKLARA